MKHNVRKRTIVLSLLYVCTLGWAWAAQRVEFDPADPTVANRVIDGPRRSLLREEAALTNYLVARSPQDISTASANRWNNPEALPAVASRYLKVVGNDVVEMTQPEKDAIDQALMDISDDTNRQSAVDLPESISAEGTAQRSSIETSTNNVNGVKNRIKLIFNVLAAGMESTGGADNMRQAMIDQAALPFPQELTAAALRHFPNVNLLTQRQAIDIYKTEAASGNQDRPPVK